MGQCGVNDIINHELVPLINKYGDLIDKTATTHPQRHVIINEIPLPSPGNQNSQQNYAIANLNAFLTHKCSTVKNTHFLPLGLKPHHMRGQYLSGAGISLVSKKLDRMVQGLQSQNFISQQVIHIV